MYSYSNLDSVTLPSTVVPWFHNVYLFTALFLWIQTCMQTCPIDQYLSAMCGIHIDS